MITTAVVATGLAEPHHFTLEEYLRMAETGVLGNDDRVELIRGEIIQMSPIGFGHMACVDRQNMYFAGRLDGRAIVRVQGSIQIPFLHSMPQPDLVLLRWRDDFYAGVGANPEDILLIIEVADSTLAYDRRIKAPLYAEAGIPEYWVWDLNGRALLRYLDPAAEGYRIVSTLTGETAINPLAFPDLTLTPAAFLPTV